MSAALVVIAFSVACSQAAIACGKEPDMHGKLMGALMVRIAVCSAFLAPVAALLERLI